MKCYKFYKEKGIWFIHMKWFPRYFRGHLAMVAGADVLLDMLAEGKEEVTLKVSTKMHEIHFCPICNYLSKQDSRTVCYNNFELLYKRHSLGTFSGAVYGVTQHEFETDLLGKNQLWLCWVTLLVFGKYPDRIFVEVV